MSLRDQQVSRKIINLKNEIQKMNDLFTEIGGIVVTSPAISSETIEKLVRNYENLSYMGGVLVKLGAKLENFLDQVQLAKRDKRYAVMQKTIENSLKSLRTSIADETRELNELKRNSLKATERGNKELTSAKEIIATNKKNINSAIKKSQSKTAEFTARVDQILDELDVVKGTDETRSLNEAKVMYSTLGERYKQLEAYLETLKNTNDSFEASGDRIQQDIANLTSAYEDLVSKVQFLTSLDQQIRNEIMSGEEDIVQDKDTVTCETIYQKPKVIVYEVAPPKIDLDDFANNDQIQLTVKEKLAPFVYEVPELKPDGFSCPKPGDFGAFNNAQKIAYHYMSPISTNLNILLYHSAGSGKTATMMAIASVFNRAGYTTLIVTKKPLRNAYFSAAFEQGADFNVQHYLASKGVSSIRELIAKENRVSQKEVSAVDVHTRGFLIWEQMGISFNETHCFISFDQLANTARKVLDGVFGAREEYFLKLQKNNNKDSDKKNLDPFAKVIVLIDEVHKMVINNSDGTRTGVLPYVHQVFFRSRDMSGNDAVRVVVATATPIVEGIVDLIWILNLLVKREDAVILNDPDETYEKNEDAKRAAKQTYKRSESAINITDLVKGRISYLDLTGDRSTFAARDVQWADVHFSVYQEKSIEKCFSQAQLQYDAQNKQWRLPKGVTEREEEEEYDDAEEEEEEEEIITKGKGKKIKTKTVKPSNSSTRDCIMKSYNFPFLDNTKKRQEYVQPTTKLERAAFSDYSPMLAELLNAVERDHLKSQSIMSAYNAKNRSPGAYKVNALKQYIFCDLARSPYADVFGVDLIAAMLRTLKYESITTVGKSGGIQMKSPDDLKKIPMYKGMMVLNRKTRTPAQKTKSDKTSPEERVQSDVKNYFNSKDNADGRNCSIAILNGIYKEGHELYNVGYVYIVGYIDSRADLVQAVARAFRNCRSTSLPWSPENGSSVTVRMFSPTFGPNSKYAGGKQLISDIVDSVSSVDKSAKVIEEVSTMLKNSAFDRYLLDPINSASRLEEEKLQLVPK